MKESIIMKYVLKTEKNASGNVVFSKERRGKKYEKS